MPFGLGVSHPAMTDFSRGWPRPESAQSPEHTTHDRSFCVQSPVQNPLIQSIKAGASIKSLSVYNFRSVCKIYPVRQIFFRPHPRLRASKGFVDETRLGQIAETFVAHESAGPLAADRLDWFTLSFGSMSRHSRTRVAISRADLGRTKPQKNSVPIPIRPHRSPTARPTGGDLPAGRNKKISARERHHLTICSAISPPPIPPNAPAEARLPVGSPQTRVFSPHPRAGPAPR
jgi:hypothetical protein